MQNKNWLLIAAFVYLIAILLRFYYPFVLGEFEEYFYHNALLLNTNDGYFYAQGARDILAGDLYRYDPKENQSVLIARDIPYDRKSTGSGVASIGIGVTEHYYFFRYDDPLPDADTEKALSEIGKIYFEKSL